MVACISRAVAEGSARVILHSTPVMTAAHALYEGLGFTRTADLDILIVDEPYDEAHPLHLLAFTLELG